jgi:superfamily II DNA or RNA helicase
LQLRPYQLAAFEACLGALRRGKHPVIQSATGTGKSLIIAALASAAKQRGLRTWVLTHVQQLVEQNAATYERFTGDPEYGIVCSGLNRADFDRGVTFATIQSIINPGLRGELHLPDLVIIDEAHRVPHTTGETGQYGRLFERFPSAQRVAMTATPWRMDGGLIYGKGKNFWFDELSFVYTVPQGVADGWLSPIVGVETETQLELGEVTVNGDYSNAEVAELQDNDWLRGVALALLQLAPRRQHIAVYCPTIAAAMRAAAVIGRVTECNAGVLTGGMSREVRAEVMQQFKSGDLRVLCSVDTLTTGFDFPALDCLVCLRPTTSSSLWVQIMGRLTRLHPGKKNGLLLDFVGNLQRLGGVDTLDNYVRQRAPLEQLEALPQKPKEPRRVLPGVRTLAVIDPLSGEQATDGSLLVVEVHSVNSVAIPTRRNPKEPALLVQYTCTTVEGARIDASLFLNTERPNADADLFFKNRRLAVNLPSPARSLGWQLKGAQHPTHVTVRKSGRYWNVVAERFP